MGNERRHLGKHVHVCFAILTVLLVSCVHDRPRGLDATTLQEHVTGRSGRWEPLKPVRAAIENSDFEGAIRDYQRLLSSPGGNECADLALFDLGLLYAHPDNPGRDYRKSLTSFSRLLKEHPRSPLAGEARIWAAVLEMLEQAKRVDLELEEMKKALNN